MPSELNAWVHRWFDQVWNEGRLDAIDELMASDAPMHGLSDGTGVIGTEKFRRFTEQFRGAFPDVRITIRDTVEQGDMIVARWTATMTHAGDDLGVPATHRRVGVTGISMARVQNGVMVEGWNNWDSLALMEQIGVIPARGKVPQPA